MPLRTDTAAPDRPHHLLDSYIRFQSQPIWSGSLPIRCGTVVVDHRGHGFGREVADDDLAEAGDPRVGLDAHERAALVRSRPPPTACRPRPSSADSRWVVIPVMRIRPSLGVVARHNATLTSARRTVCADDASGPVAARAARRWTTSSWPWRPTPRSAPADTGAPPPRPGLLLSLYWFDYTIELGEPARTGHVAYAWSDGADGSEAFETVLTDAPEIAGGLGGQMRPGQWPMADPDRAAKPATFLRRGTQPWGFDFRVTGADGQLIEARWADLSAPVFGTGPARGGGVAIATMLTESLSPSVRVNGRSYPGRVLRTRSGRRGSAASAAPASSASARPSTNPSTDHDQPRRRRPMTTEPTTRLSFEGTKRAMAEGAKYIPGGASSDYRIGEGALVLERGEGPFLYDIDGNRLIDYFCGAGPIILGHNPPELVEIMTRQLQKGVILGGETEDEYEAARLMTELVPVAEMVRFANTGSEAVALGVPDRPRGDRSRHHRQVRGPLPRLVRQRVRRPAASRGRRHRHRSARDSPARTRGRRHTPRSCPGTTSTRSRTGSPGATSPRSSPSRSGAATSRPPPGYLAGLREITQAPQRRPDLRRDRVGLPRRGRVAASSCSTSRPTSRPSPRRSRTASRSARSRASAS